MCLCIGIYRVTDVKIDLGLASVAPLSLNDRLFPRIANTRNRMEYARSESTAYDLLLTPQYGLLCYMMMQGAEDDETNVASHDHREQLAVAAESFGLETNAIQRQTKWMVL